jgi:hypothetical protein
MNAYLAQLEAEGQGEAVYGKGVQLIVPEPWFVVKTKDVSGANRVYINICTSPKVNMQGADKKAAQRHSYHHLLACPGAALQHSLCGMLCIALGRINKVQHKAPRALDSTCHCISTALWQCDSAVKHDVPSPHRWMR